MFGCGGSGGPMERGVRKFDPYSSVDVIPMIDGGEGFAKTITQFKRRYHSL